MNSLVSETLYDVSYLINYLYASIVYADKYDRGKTSGRTSVHIPRMSTQSRIGTPTRPTSGSGDSDPVTPPVKEVQPNLQLK